MCYLNEPDELTVQQKSPTPRVGQPIGNSKTYNILSPITGQPGGVYHVLVCWQGKYSRILAFNPLTYR